ncbi:MAG: multidrug effflux MFS transporter [Clostridiales Family XIII bacterium]|jgi:DHA1 family bicyclomycin/chloramphenicol resistance-like MFS transporter|nr:multidrug effflux MFS transporter [Clostridiales Family XIII bacterium]
MEHNEIKQRRLGKGAMLVFLTMLGAFPALSTDLYLPALPMMARVFETTASLTNLTLIIFFITSAVMTLVWGPLSDKFGRRPILIIGTTCYFVASMFCMAAWSIWTLIVARVLQAAGGAAATSMGIAIVKDAYAGRLREKTLAIINSMVIICPTVAPILGAFLMNFTSWRGIFLLQSVFGALVFCGSLLYTETIPERLTTGMFRSLTRLAVVIQCRPFLLLLIIFSVQNAASMAFIGASSYIYQEYYGLSSQIYSFFFSANALCMMGGPFIYTWLSRYFSRFSIITVCFVICTISGAAILGLAGFGPFAFALSLLPSFIAASCTKPPGISMMLDQQKHDAGSASSLISSANMLTGTLGIYFASLSIWDFAHLVGLITLVMGVISFAVWIIFYRLYGKSQSANAE